MSMAKIDPRIEALHAHALECARTHPANIEVTQIYENIRGQLSPRYVREIIEASGPFALSMFGMNMGNFDHSRADGSLLENYPANIVVMLNNSPTKKDNWPIILSVAGMDEDGKVLSGTSMAGEFTMAGATNAITELFKENKVEFVQYDEPQKRKEPPDASGFFTLNI